LCASSFLLVPGLLLAQEAGSLVSAPAIRTGSAAAVEVGPTVDGRLDDPAWQNAIPLTNFVQHEPVEGSPSSERTEVRIVYDADALYIGAYLYDREPNRIIVGERRRDANLSESDAFQVILDTFRDRQNAFVFGTTAGAIEFD